MKTGILKSLALTALVSGACLTVIAHAAEARVILNANTVNTQRCDGYTRTFIDGYGYQRSATGTACLQPNGEWVVVSETLDAFSAPAYQQRVIYRDAPSYYVRPQYVYVDDRNTHWRHDNGRHRGWDRRDHGHYNR